MFGSRKRKKDGLTAKDRKAYEAVCAMHGHGITDVTAHQAALWMEPGREPRPADEEKAWDSLLRLKAAGLVGWGAAGPRSVRLTPGPDGHMPGQACGESGMYGQYGTGGQCSPYSPCSQYGMYGAYGEYAGGRPDGQGWEVPQGYAPAHMPREAGGWHSEEERRRGGMPR